MRVLFAVWPMSAHLYPMIPVAWALQGAGHEVRIASHPDLVDVITSAGLTAVSLGTRETMPPLWTIGDHMLPREEQDRLAEELGIGPDDRVNWEMFSNYTLTSMRIFHSVGPQGCPGVDDLVGFARDWQADLVLWDLVWPAGAVAARACGAAHARLLWGADYSGWAMDKIAARRQELGAPVENPLADLMRPVAERHGLEVDEELLLGQWSIDPTPEDVRLPSTTRVVPLRRIPFTGAEVVPDWLYPVPERPRVAMTLGTSSRMFTRSDAMVSAMLEMVSDLDIEVIATFDESQLEGQTVPGNVRTVDYLPLDQLLPTCSVIIHHGGGGTFAAAVANRVPQLIDVDEGLDSTAYANYLTSHGAGLPLNHREQSVDEMRKQLVQVLNEPSFQYGADALHADWLAMPSPNDIVPVLEKLTAQHRRRSN